jgi:rhodanese-related sulfurtransferase
MSEPEDEPAPASAYERSVVDRLQRVDWNIAKRSTDRGFALLPPEFVAEQGHTLRIIDVRSTAELEELPGRVPGSVSVPLSEIERVARELPADALLVLVSGDGRRALEGVERLSALGMGWVAALDGGLRAWKDRGYATETGPVSASPPLSGSIGRSPRRDRKAPLSIDEVRAHVGDPHQLRWAKLAGFLLHGKISCVDGRDGHGVVGTPGGDMGELVLTLAAIERMTSVQLDERSLPGVLAKWVEGFGHFYFHTDVGALDRYIARLRADSRIDEALLPRRNDPPIAWRRFSASPPLAIRPYVLEHWVTPEATGCGHLRLMMMNPSAYGVRPGLVEAVVRAFILARWQGLAELEFVPLGGSHHEGAVVNVHVAEQVAPYTLVPLVSPEAGGLQMFVNHPGVTHYLRGLSARFACTHLGLGLDPADATSLHATMTELGKLQASATLSTLAKGLPIYDLRFGLDRSFVVETAGHVG